QGEQRSGGNPTVSHRARLSEGGSDCARRGCRRLSLAPRSGPRLSSPPQPRSRYDAPRRDQKPDFRAAAASAIADRMAARSMAGDTGPSIELPHFPPPPPPPPLLLLLPEPPLPEPPLPEPPLP